MKIQDSKTLELSFQWKTAAIWVILYWSFSFVCFPGLDQTWAAWFALVPFLLLIRESAGIKHRWKLLLSVEWVKWILLVAWLRHVSWVAMFGISLGFAGFGICWYFIFSRNLKRFDNGVPFLTLLTLGCLWAAIEWLRTQPYGLTGSHYSITQWKSPIVLQIASVVGGYGLSAILVVSNLLIYSAICALLNYENLKTNWIVGKGVLVSLFSLSLLVCGVMGFGYLRIESNMTSTEKTGNNSITFGIVQPNQPAYLQWNLEKMQKAVTTVFEYTGQLVRTEDIDVVVWPEGTLPGSIYPGSPLEVELENLVDRAIKKPLLLGNQVQRGNDYYNGVLLCLPEEGVVTEFYAKRILVPFGEFIPFRRFLKGIDTIVPIPSDFKKGETQVSLELAVNADVVNIGALVCYEDCFPSLLLEDDLSAIDLIFVATYNVWYGEEFGAYYHAAHSVLRAVEVGRPILRCGSAGWSGLIDSWGRIVANSRSSEDSIYFGGYGTIDWNVRDDLVGTFYKSNYNLIHAIFAIGAAIVIIRSRNSKQRQGNACP